MPYDKFFEIKFLVPRDIPGVTGAPISGGCNSRISPTSVSGHIGSIQLPWHRGMPRTCQRTKTFSMTVCYLSSCEVLVHRLLRDTKKLVRWPKELREAIRATFSQWPTDNWFMQINCKCLPQFYVLWIKIIKLHWIYYHMTQPNLTHPSSTKKHDLRVENYIFGAWGALGCLWAGSKYYTHNNDGP